MNEPAVYTANRFVGFRDKTKIVIRPPRDQWRYKAAPLYAIHGLEVENLCLNMTYQRFKYAK